MATWTNSFLLPYFALQFHNHSLTHPPTIPRLSTRQRLFKRCFDIVIASFGLLFAAPLITVGWVIARFSSGASGFFVQQRIGLRGVPFPLFKLRTMRVLGEVTTTVTSGNDIRITPMGAVLRKLKIDELPQLANVLLGHMSLVGPRPDVPGFADQLEGVDQIILSVQPGITGPATLRFRKEEEILANATDPESYNREVIWPEKVRLNTEYIENYSIWTDIKCLAQTALPMLAKQN